MVQPQGKSSTGKLSIMCLLLNPIKNQLTTMITKHSILLFITGLFIFSGCHHAQVVTDREPSAQVYEDKMANSFLFGLIPPKTVRAQDECPNGVARFETKRSFLNGLVSAITFNIYTPMHIELTCASSSADTSVTGSNTNTTNREDVDTQNTETVQGSVQEGDIKIGAGLVFGSGIGSGDFDNDLGIRVDGYYAITPEFRAGGDFTFYFPKKEELNDNFGSSVTNKKLTVWELNLNGNYIFLDEDDMIIYGLAGVNITGISASRDVNTNVGNSSGSDSTSELGLNLGGGIEYALDFADFFGEVKLGGLGGDADQFVLGVGLRLPISP
jgi:opacity protein-like surface antigen